jgi:hypothetical protein
MLAEISRGRFPCVLLGGLALAVVFVGCGPIQEFRMKRTDRHNEAGELWLSDQMFPPAVDVSGTYRTPDWGTSLLVQNGRDVRGHLGDYPVKGVVSGQRVYLLVSEGGWYYYSAILEVPRDGVLVGYYSRSVPYRKSMRRDLQMFAIEP